MQSISIFFTHTWNVTGIQI